MNAPQCWGGVEWENNIEPWHISHVQKVLFPNKMAGLLIFKRIPLEDKMHYKVQL